MTDVLYSKAISVAATSINSNRNNLRALEQTVFPS